MLLLPATAAMGATLPAMERVVAGVPALYAANTAGAVLGVLAAAFWLVPASGLVATASACASLNFLCAIVAALLFMGRTNPPALRTSVPIARFGPLLAMTGFLGIGYEALVVRVLSQVAENTVYTFAILLAVYLVGTALGAAAYRRWIGKAKDQEDALQALLRIVAIACTLGIVALAFALPLKGALAGALGGGFHGALAVESFLAAAAFLLPSMAMGALFCHIASRARSAGVPFGRALAFNTFGAAIAPPFFGALLVLGFAAKVALAAVAVGYLALGARGRRLAPAQWAVVTSIAATCALVPSLAIIDVPPGGRVVSHAEGALAAVSVVEDASGVARLHINNRQQEGSSATRYSDARQALLPLLLHPGPRDALFLGLGTGVTAFSATQDPRLRVDAVELLPEVVAASKYFTHGLGRDGGPRIVNADARRFVRATAKRYDVIVSDNFHPARSGSGSLYTVEHFAAVRERLAPGGLFCQWLPLHQLDVETLRVIVRSFLAVYPRGTAILATLSLDTPVIGLVGHEGDARVELTAARQRLEDAVLALDPASFGLPDDLALLGSFIAGPRALVRFAGDAPLNTDDRPFVAYRAPRITYAPDSRPRDRLSALRREFRRESDDIVAGNDGAWFARLSAYGKARDQFLDAGRAVVPTADVRQMLAQVRGPLLSVLRTSPDFRPAYDPLLRMALALAKIDEPAARALLMELQEIRLARDRP